MWGRTVDPIPKNASHATHYTELIRCLIIKELFRNNLVHLFILKGFCEVINVR